MAELLSAVDPELSDGDGAIGAITAGGRVTFGDIGCCCRVGALAAVGFSLLRILPTSFFAHRSVFGRQTKLQLFSRQGILG